MKKLFWTLGILAGGLIVATVIYQILGGTFLGKHFTFWPKTGWKQVSGCVAYSGQEVDYQFYAPKDWFLITPDMGCGTSYADAQSFGLKDQIIADEISNIALGTILLMESTPSDYDTNSFDYLTVPDNGKILELGRITVHDGDKTTGLTDQEWVYLKNSFRFK